MKNEVEQIALQNDMSIEFVTWFFNEKKVGCGNVWFMMMAAMWEGWKGALLMEWSPPISCATVGR